MIPQTAADKITNSHSVEDSRGHLFDHMRVYGTITTLKVVFCDVIISEEYNGFQAMQDFESRLEQEGRCVCMLVYGWCGVVVCCLSYIFWANEFRERVRALVGRH